MSEEYIRREDAIDLINKISNLDLKAKGGICVSLANLQKADVVQVVRCKDCIHNNDCDIQYSAQAGENFFCGFGETEKDVREDVYE